MFFKDVLEKVLDDYRLDGSPTSAHTYRWLGRQAMEWFGDRLIAEITPDELQALVRRQKERVSAATVTHQVCFLSRVFEQARAKGLEITNPCKGLKRPRINNRRERILTREEEALWRPTMTKREWSLVKFAVNTGVRRLEQFRLKKTDIQFSERKVNGALRRVGTAKIETSKTGVGRTIALNPVAADIAALWCKHEPDCEYLFAPERTGKRICVANSITRELIQRARCVGIQDLVWHSLRHTAACRALRAGATIRDVQRFLGHSSIVQTERYLHWTEDDTWTAALKLCK